MEPSNARDSLALLPLFQILQGDVTTSATAIPSSQNRFPSYRQQLPAPAHPSGNHPIDVLMTTVLYPSNLLLFPN